MRLCTAALAFVLVAGPAMAADPAPVGAPTLTVAKKASEAGNLPLGAEGLAGATMFGAHDVRGGAGKATPVD